MVGRGDRCQTLYGMSENGLIDQELFFSCNWFQGHFIFITPLKTPKGRLLVFQGASGKEQAVATIIMCSECEIHTYKTNHSLRATAPYASGSDEQLRGLMLQAVTAARRKGSSRKGDVPHTQSQPNPNPKLETVSEAFIKTPDLRITSKNQ